MNILRHKSWHVRTKKNIARVRRDEENARKEVEAKQFKADNAEKSARIEYLRKKRGEGSSKDPDQTAQYDESKLTFELFKDHKDKGETDRDKDGEQRAEQEKWEVKAGIFSYLDGRYKHEKNDQDHWYTKSANDRRLLPEEDFKDNNNKGELDQFEMMKKYNKKIEFNRSHNKKNISNETILKSPTYSK